MSNIQQISFTPRQELEYGELFNSQLNAIPIRTLDDFRVVTLALRAISLQTTLPKEEPSWNSLCDRVESLQDTYDHPEMFAEPKHHNNFKKQLIEQIIRKIEELKELSSEEKLARIDNQLAKKNQALEFQALIADHPKPPPRSLTQIRQEEQDLLREAQNRFHRENQRHVRPRLYPRLGERTEIVSSSWEDLSWNTYIHNAPNLSAFFPF